MSTIATLKPYDLLRVKLGEAEARSFVETFEASVEEKFLEHKDILATKADLAEVKAEMIKWMFIFWLGGIGVLAGLLIGVAKGFIR
jgi:hypothetical protein